MNSILLFIILIPFIALFDTLIFRRGFVEYAEKIKRGEKKLYPFYLFQTAIEFGLFFMGMYIGMTFG